MASRAVKLIVAFPFALAIGAGLGVVHGTAEIWIRDFAFDRHFPLVCIFYSAAGAAAGAAGWLCIAGTQTILPVARRLVEQRLSGFLLTACLACGWGAVLALEGMYRFLPHEVAPSTLAFAGAVGLLVLGLAIGLGRATPSRLARTLDSAMVLLALAAVAVAVGAQPGVLRVEPTEPAAEPAPGAPNVVLILIDTLRADHLSSYGYPRPTSPNIDAIAEQGVRFDRAFSQAPWTKPSVESLFTSRFPSSLSGSDLFAPLPGDVATLPEILNRAGYATAGFVGNPVIHPNFGFQRGFDFFYYGYLDFNRLHLYRYMQWLDLIYAPWYANRSDYLTGRVTHWFEEAQPEASQRPLFLYVHYMDPHEPYRSRPPFAEMFRTPGIAPIKVLPYPLPKNLPFDAIAEDAVPQDEIAARIDAYDACIRQNDHAVGALVGELKQRGLWDDTLFVLVADHGEEFMDHGGWGHGQSVYQELIRVPLVLRLPRGRHAGAELGQNVMLVDVLPTIARLSGAALPSDIEGRNLLPLLDGGAADSAVPAFAEDFGPDSRQSAVIRGPWKWIRSRRGTETRRLLFRLDSDPGESRDLIAAESEPAPRRVATALEELAERELASGARDSVTELEEGVRLRLRELGYVE